MHNNFIRISCSAFVIIFFYSCVTTKDSNQFIEINKTNVISDVDFSKYIDKYRIVNLETNDDCLIGSIRDIQFADNKIFILNFRADENELLIFDNYGKFLTKVGQKGQGPQEYLSMVTFSVNPFQKQIIIFDTLKKCIHKFGYNGIYLESTPLKSECGLLLKTRFISKDRMVCVNGINSRSNTLVFECDGNLSNQNIISITKLTDRGLFVYADNPISNNGEYFLKPLSNLVYTNNNEELVPVYKVDLNTQNYNPESDIEKGGDYKKFFYKSLQNGFFPLNGIFDTRNYLLILQNGYFTLLNKTTNYGQSNVSNIYGVSNKILPFSPSSVIGSTDNEFVCSINNEIRKKIKDYYNKNELSISDKNIISFLNNSNEENNPVLVFYQLKP